ncbi:AlpA family phage regulatory protein [Oceanicaulis sp. HTCC2633]|uniref:helix-turn-helix transcriptional regulator n=1 Tax=Oceanicaulis sp. HTCC2633 TaxID=314254 RepID=UPI000A0272BD
MTSEPDATEQMLKIKEVTKLTSLSRSTIYALVDAGRFPRPRRLAARRVAWSREDVRQWMNACTAAK